MTILLRYVKILTIKLLLKIEQWNYTTGLKICKYDSNLNSKGGKTMGMSASQGRMLLLTVRKSDLEFQAQQISQKRLILSQQLEKISQDYENATSNRQMKISLYGQGDAAKYGAVSKNLTYATLMSGTWANLNYEQAGVVPPEYAETTSEYRSNNNYRLVSVDGAIVVADKSEIPNTTVVKNEQKLGSSEKVYSSADKENYPAKDNEGKRAKNLSFEDLMVNPKGEFSSIGKPKYGTLGGKTVIQVPFKEKDSDTEKFMYFTVDNYKIGNYDSEASGDQAFIEKEEPKFSYTKTSKKDNSGVETTTVGYEFTQTTETVESINGFKLTEGHDGRYELEYKDKDGNEKRITYIVDPALKTGITDAFGNADGPNYLQDCIRNGKYLLQQGSQATDDQNKLNWKNLSWDSTSNINDEYYTADDNAAKARYDRLQAQIQNQDKKLELELDNIETQRSAVTT